MVNFHVETKKEMRFLSVNDVSVSVSFILRAFSFFFKFIFSIVKKLRFADMSFNLLILIISAL